MKRAVFLDRDGTIIEDRNFISRTEDVHFIPRAPAALRALQREGFRLFIVTNQSGVGRGLFEIEDVARVHRFLAAELSKQGVSLDGVYVCPHHPNDGCDCRKPSAKLVRDAARTHGLDLTQSFFIGDRLSDVETGRAAGCTPILVETGKGKEELSRHEASLLGVQVARDLAAAARLILKAKPRTLAA